MRVNTPKEPFSDTADSATAALLGITSRREGMAAEGSWAAQKTLHLVVRPAFKIRGLVIQIYFG